MTKSIFIAFTPTQEEVTRRTFTEEWLELKFVSVSHYLGYLFGLIEDM